MGVLPIVLLALLAVSVVNGYPSSSGVAMPTAKSSLLLRRLAMVEARGNDDDEDDDEDDEEASTPATTSLPKPEMYSLKVTSHIAHRFANTLIASRLANPANQSQQIYFSVTLPESAFISRFLMEIEGKVYEAYVKEKEAAKQEYDQAVASGLGAAHVALSARDSNRFTVSVNIEPQSKVRFNLTYEELLTRRLGAYNHVINLDPGQVVRDLTVDVFITESTNITTLRVPELRSGNEVDANELTKANPLARIVRKSPTQAHVSFAPTVEQQKELGQVKKQEDLEQDGQKDKEGLGGQFVVQYDVDRKQQGGEILVNEGFFVHFFAPQELAPLKKHALFVLDVSGSMGGRKIEQLKQAMNAILDDLNEGDFFNIIEFSYSVKVWNLDSTAASAVFSPYNAYNYDAPAPNPGPTPAFPATADYVAKAKDIVSKMRAGGGTNIFDTLKTVIKVAHTGLENITTLGDERREPIIVFLTDGEPTVGETRLDKIFSVVQELNAQPEAAIFSLAFGDDADLGFLKKLSLKNAGFARKIYEASDAALQLRDFYRQIASPLLANVTFNYVPDKVVKDSTTRINFHTLFSGSELVVAGKLSRLPDSALLHDSINGEIVGISATGASSIPIFHPSPIDFIPDAPRVEREVSSLERLWAYLTIKQLLEKEETNAVEQSGNLGDKMETEASANETKTPKQQALELALKYSFVTPLTSLVVVKPNETKSTGVEAVNPGMVDRISLSGISLPLSQSVVEHFSQPISISSAGASSGYGGQAPLSGAFARPSYPASVPGPVAPMTAPKRPSYQSTTTRQPDEPAQEEYESESLQAVNEEVADVAGVEADKDIPVTAETTTNLPLPQEPVLISIGDLEWLPLVLNATEVTLPFGVNNADVCYQIFKTNDPEITTDVPCKTPEGDDRTCVHLHECSLSVFKKEIAAYRPFFCQLGNYAGVCCPEIPTNGVTPKSLPWDKVFFPNANITTFPTEKKEPRPVATTDKDQPNHPDYYLTLQGSQNVKIAPTSETRVLPSLIAPTDDTHVQKSPAENQQPNDPAYYQSVQGSQNNQVLRLPEDNPEAALVANAGSYPIQDASPDIRNVAGPTKETSVINAESKPMLQGSVTGNDTVVAEEANVESSTAVVRPVEEQPNDAGVYPIQPKVSEVPEMINEESSALNPGFHPVHDMKTSIVEADPKPV